MKLELNIKEWLAVYGLLERQSTGADKHLVEVHNRMKATLVSVLSDAERNMFDVWFAQTQQRISSTDKTEPIPTPTSNVLTDDDNELTRDVYPKPSKSAKQPFNKRQRSR